MATITKKITLTEKNDSGPLYDLYWSSDNGNTYTSSVDATNLYLPFVGASTVANVDSTATTFQLRSKDVCINAVTSGSIGPTPTPTACLPGLIRLDNVGYSPSSPASACGFLTTVTVYVDNTDFTLTNEIKTDITGCTDAPPEYYSYGGNFIRWSGAVNSRGLCSLYPTATPLPTATPTPSPTPFAGPTPTPTPTPTPAWVQYSAHNIVKSSLYQHKSVWFGSSNMYQAQQLVTYLTGQSVPSTSTPYSLSNANYKIYDSTNVERGSWSSASGTAMYYFDGIDAVVQVDNIFISGSYLNGSSSTYDTWQYSKL